MRLMLTKKSSEDTEKGGIRERSPGLKKPLGQNIQNP
jgi:hypothetical protein